MSYYPDQRGAKTRIYWGVSIAIMIVWFFSFFIRAEIAVTSRFGLGLENGCIVTSYGSLVRVLLQSQLDFRLGVGFESVVGDRFIACGRGGCRRYSFWPLWIPSLISFFVAVGISRRAMRHVREGYCTACNYDLTGNVSGRCPECGTIISESAEQVV